MSGVWQVINRAIEKNELTTKDREILLRGALIGDGEGCERLRIWRWPPSQFDSASYLKHCIKHREDHGDTSGSTSGSKQQFDWQLFSHGGRLWVWRCSTQECFFVDKPPVSWARYFCPAGKFYWWHNDLSEAWFLENSSSHPNQTSY